jgi:hypothetical protein
MIVTGPQTYSGGTMIVGGNLQLGDDLAAGSIVGSVVTSGGGALVIYNANISVAPPSASNPLTMVLRLFRPTLRPAQDLRPCFSSIPHTT